MEQPLHSSEVQQISPHRSLSPTLEVGLTMPTGSGVASTLSGVSCSVSDQRKSNPSPLSADVGVVSGVELTTTTTVLPDLRVSAIGSVNQTKTTPTLDDDVTVISNSTVHLSTVSASNPMHSSPLRNEAFTAPPTSSIKKDTTHLLAQSPILLVTGQPAQEKTTACSKELTPEELERYFRETTVTPPVAARNLGAWEKPLSREVFAPAATPTEPATPRGEDTQLDNSLWPTLMDGVQANQRKKVSHPAKKTMPNLPVEKLPPPLLKADGSLRFPWAAKMDPATRNLYRAASPTYRIDGTPQVTIPSKVLLLGPENREQYVIGQFHRCSSPPGGLVHAVVNRLWGRSCKISIKKHGESSFIFHIPHESTRSWVIQRGVWHIDDCLMFVAPWSPTTKLKNQEISSLPVWVNLKNIPESCFSRLGISHIASGLGEPMLTHRPRLDPTQMGEAKILVEVELDKPFPKIIACDDKQGSIYLVEVEYTWIPSTCERCGSLGHKEKRCLLPPNTSVDANKTVTDALDKSSTIPVVSIETFMQQNDVKNKHHLSHEKEAERCLSTTPKKNLEREGNCLVEEDKEVKDFSSPVMTDQVQAAANYVAQEVSSPITETFSQLAATLAGIVPAPTEKSIMELSPSSKTIISGENSQDDRANSTLPIVLSTQNEATSEMRYQHGSVDENESSFNITRGGRQIRPTTKMQEMEWTTARKKSRRGRGRGS